MGPAPESLTAAAFIAAFIVGGAALAWLVATFGAWIIVGYIGGIAAVFAPLVIRAAAPG